MSSTDMSDRSAWAELAQGWKLLLACSVGIGLGLSPIPTYTSGIMATELTRDFGWPRGQILGAIILTTISLLLLGAFVGRLTDTYGPRKVAMLSTVGLSLGLASLSLINDHIGSFYVAWGFIAIVALGTLPVTYARVVTTSFQKARGAALGLALASTGFTGALYPFYLDFLIHNYGWRIAYVGLALPPLLIALPILWLWLEEPKTSSKGHPDNRNLEGITLAQALRRYRFWASAIAAMGLGAATGGLMPNLLPVLQENGMQPAAASEALAIMAISVTAGRLLSGVLLDRLWAPVVATLLVLPATIGMYALLQPGLSIEGARLSAAVIGLIAGAEFDLVAYITGRYFGRKHFSEIYGVQYAIFGLGAGSAPAIYGFISDITNSYQSAIWLSIALLLGSVCLLFTLGRYPTQVH